MPRPVRHRVAHWNSLSKKLKSKAMRPRRSAASALAWAKLIGEEGMRREQTLLARACNAIALDAKLVAKALRMGARPGEACDSLGNLAMHLHGRHGQSCLEAGQLLAWGFDPMAQDGLGQIFAHHAFAHHNLPMARWIMDLRPESWDARDSNGFSPMDFAAAERAGAGMADREKVDGDFRAWALGAMPAFSKAAYLLTAWRQILRLMAARHREPDGGLAWLSSLGANAGDPADLRAHMATLPPWVKAAAEPFVEAAIAIHEREALSLSSPETASQGSSRASL